MKDIKERLFSYLNGDMEVPDKQFFDHEIWRDKFLELIKENNLLDIQSQKKIRRISVKRKHLVIAAGILIIWGISVVFFNNPSKSQNDRIFASYYQPYKNDYNSGYRAAETTNNFNDAVQLYDNGKYQDAVNQLQGVIKNNTIDLDVHFFIGLSFIELKDYKKAIENFSYVITKSNYALSEHTKWYLALCYLKTDQTRKGVSLLKEIANTDNYYKQLAKEVLKKIK